MGLGFALACLGLGIAPNVDAQSALPDAQFAGAKLNDAKAAPVIAKHHMVAAADPYAVNAALTMLRAGGTAVDAAIAAQMVLNLVEPQSSGIGGGAFLLFGDRHGALTGYDGREQAPASVTPAMFLNPDGTPMRLRDAIPGGISIGVPGDVAMLAQAHKEHGKLPWAKLFEPTIQLAENGFTVPPRLGEEIGGFLKNTDMPDVRAAYFHEDGSPYKAGETMKNPALAATFRTIAQGGPDAFYKGKLAQEIVDKVQHAPHHQGGMTLADLAAYKPHVRPAVCAPYRGYRVCSMQAGNGGVTVLQILGLLQRFPAKDLQPTTFSETHLMSEAEKLAYADRVEYLGDPAFVTAPVAGMLDNSYLKSRSALIDPAHALKDVTAGTPPVKHAENLNFAPQVTPVAHGTSHMTIVDDAGNVVSMTTSVESGFGSHVMAGGFILNNELTDFSFEPTRDGKPVANAVAPGKRPLSAMSPMIIFGPDGKFFAAIGSPGGRTIICYVAQAIVALIDGKATMPQAVSYPHHINDGGPSTGLEKDTALEAFAPQLTALGDSVHLSFEPSGLNGIRRVSQGYEGGSDPRRDGIAAGD